MVGELCFLVYVALALFFFGVKKSCALWGVRKSIGDATPVLGLLVRSVRLVPLWHV